MHCRLFVKIECLSAHVRNVYLLSLILRTPTPRVWTDQICYHFHKFVRKVDFKDIFWLTVYRTCIIWLEICQVLLNHCEWKNLMSVSCLFAMFQFLPSEKEICQMIELKRFKKSTCLPSVVKYFESSWWLDTNYEYQIICCEQSRASLLYFLICKDGS